MMTVEQQADLCDWLGRYTLTAVGRLELGGRNVRQAVADGDVALVLRMLSDVDETIPTQPGWGYFDED